MANLFGTGINQVPTNGMLGNLAFQDKSYVGVDAIGIGTTFVDSGTVGQPLQVSGGAYVSGSVGIGTTTPSSALTIVGNVLVSGISTLGITTTTNLTSQQLNVSGITTLGITSATNLTSQQLNVSGISTLGVTSASNLTSQQLNVSGITTLGVTSTTNLTSQQLNVSGISTFNNNIHIPSSSVGIGTTNPLQRLQIGTANTLGINTTGTVFVVTSNADVGIGTTNPTSKLHVIGDGRFTGVITATTFSGTLSGFASTAGVSTSVIGGIASVTQLTVSGISTFNGNVYVPSSSVGIGTTNPLQRLQIGTANTLGINTNGTVFVVTSNADVGIGTTNPTSKLHVIGNVLIVGVSTLGVTSTTNLTSQQLNVSGITTLGVVTSGNIYSAGIITASQLSTGASGTGININTDTISGPATLTIDPAAVGDNTGAVRIKGDLYVDGTQFVVNSTTIELADFNVGIATTVGTNILLDGAGIGIGSTGIRKTLTWSNSSTALKSSEDFDVASGKVYKINGTSVLSNNTLGSDIVNSSLTSVGTLGSLNVGNVYSTGIITATTFVGALTGTATTAINLNGGLAGNIVYQSAPNTTAFLTNGGSGTILQSNGVGAAPTWVAAAPTGAVTGLVVRDFNNNIVGTSGSVSQLTFSTGLSVTGTTGAAGIATITLSSNIVGTSLSISGISTFTNGPVFIGAATSTGTSGQVLQVTGGAYVSGNVGIGTTNPNVKFEVFGGSARFAQSGQGDVTISHSSFVSSIKGASTVQLALGANNTDVIRINNSGFVGVGTTNPGATLNVVPTATSIAGLFSGTTSSDMVRITQLGTGNALVVEDSTNPDSSPFVVTGIGSVGIGTASPAFAADIAGDARVTSTNKMRFGGTAGTTNFYIQYNSTANSLDFVAG